MSGSAFYRQGTADQVVVNLFYGWGYNFYRVENQLRADDLLVRAKVSAMLGAARSHVEAAEAAFRRERLPPLSRAKPLPDPDAIRGAQAIEALGRELGAVEGAIRALPVPENDRMTQLYRDEAETLLLLVDADQAMVDLAESLRTTLASATGSWIIEHTAEIGERLLALRRAIEARRDILTG